MNNPFVYVPDEECAAAFGRLCRWLDTLKHNGNAEDLNFCSELESGKMLGVLIASDKEGRRHTLYAFSGQAGSGGFHRQGFVGPAYDYLHPDGYFKTKEAEISHLNEEIAQFEKGPLKNIQSEYDKAKSRWESEIEKFREECRISKAERQARRESGNITGNEAADLIRRSQFEKAELRRLKRKATAALAPFATALKEAQAHLDALKARRRHDSEALQKWLFSNFRLLNARGESRSLSKIFDETSMKIPPSGAGECCAPKLLQATYLRGWQPVAIAEYWYGRPKGGEVRRPGEHYPACRGKCLPVLNWMLQGLDIEPPLDSDSSPKIITHDPEIIYENEWFCVIDKPSGMLSVPGKGPAISVQQWLADRYPDREVKMAHRLDRDTSGLLIATFGEESYRVMQSLFATRKVRKTYVAELYGDYEALGHPRQGRIDLPLSPDWLDRPRQRVDYKEGKDAVTEYEFTGTGEGRSRIIFRPLTGRTHQLRVHAASEQGLGMPILNDPLYGTTTHTDTPRLLLHAEEIEFTFPTDAHHYIFHSPTPF